MSSPPSSPSSTTFDFPDTEWSGSPPPQSPSPTPAITAPRHYIRDNVAGFKVANQLFRINRTLLDEETDMIPRGEDPIELTNIKPGDFEILLDFLNLGTRYDGTPLTVVDWASIIAVSSVLGMQRVLNLACKTLSDQQNNQLDISRAGAGFDRATCGMYFLIREKGTLNHLGTYLGSNVEGVQLQLQPRNQGSEDKAQIFFIDNSGVLCHAASGLAVDIVDDVPVLRRRRPVSGRPNPWSHPLPEFSFVNSQIRVTFLSDPSLPGCTDDLYPDGSWATNNFLLAAHSEKDCHMHPISDFSPWIPAAMVGSFEYQAEGNHDRKWLVLVEERTEDVGGERTSWEIVPASRTAALAINSPIERTSHRARLSPLLPNTPSTIMSAVSKFNTTGVGAWRTHSTETHKSITFSKPFAAPPGLPIGLNALDIDGGTHIRVKCSASDITKTDFVVHIDCWENTKLYSAGVSWLEVAPGDLGYQHGQFATTDVHSWDDRQAKNSSRINFARPYVTPPKVISFLTSLDMARDYNWRVITKVSDIDERGFTIHIDTWLDTMLYLGRAAWIAYPEDSPFVYSGTANVLDVRAGNNTVANNSKAIGFGGTQFWKTPSVFVALNSLDLANGRTLRIRASVDNVSTSGLTWHIDTWGDSILYSGGISYLAFCDSAVPVGGGGGGGGGPTVPPPRP